MSGRISALLLTFLLYSQHFHLVLNILTLLSRSKKKSSSLDLFLRMPANNTKSSTLSLSFWLYPWHFYFLNSKIKILSLIFFSLSLAPILKVFSPYCEFILKIQNQKKKSSSFHIFSLCLALILFDAELGNPANISFGEVWTSEI